MKHKIVFLDMDGTLYQTENDIIQDSSLERVFNTSQNYRFSYQRIKWTFSFTFLVKFLDFLYRIFSYVMV